ncbi:hypothetical protein ACLKMH_12465 [Psychromonas sp. KJ10-10]|uniref:hypothetical protein n=1 Tax=Psychromonas sp. KJ10-10 TaxID=3391823 RepID=UPI0039B3A73C
MSLLTIIQMCGGIANVLRVLQADSRILIEIKDVALLLDRARTQPYNQNLKRLTFDKSIVEDKTSLKETSC